MKNSIFYKIICRIWSLTKNLIFSLGFFIGKRMQVCGNMVVFESERDFWDNSWALYQFLLNNRVDLKYFWLVHQKKRYCVNPQTAFVRYESFMAGYHLARAKYIFFTHCMHVLTFRKEQTCVYLFHAFALKAQKDPNRSDEEAYRRHPFHYAITTGPLGVETQGTFIRCSKNEILPLGFPRNDILLNNKGKGRDNPLIDGSKYEKVILWMPTFRASSNKKLSEANCDTDTGLPLMTSIEEVNELNTFLSQENLFIICKIHHLQVDKAIFKFVFSNILFMTDNKLLEKDIQLYQMIGKTDALITDYSSISIDYLLVDRPMCFILDDIKEYKKSRGFIVDDIRTLLAGTHVYNKQDLYSWLKAVKAGVDTTKKQRDSLRTKVYSNIDNRSCERIAKMFGLIS